MNTLDQFIQPLTLKAIGGRRLAMFFAAFEQDLKPTNVPLPQQDPENDEYFSTLAAALAITESLPESLRRALFTLEAAASPQNQAAMDAAIQRRIPCVGVNRCCPLDRALELWFAVPDEL